MPTLEEIAAAVERAFDYRGDITLTLQNGETLTGYVFDRRLDGESLDRCYVRLIPKDSSQKIQIRYSEIGRIEFSGRDAADGKSFEAWVKSYNERKARGEKMISLEPENLDDPD